MRKLLIVMAAISTVLFVWKADAATWSGPSRMKAAAENYTPIENAQTKDCPTGFFLRCGSSGMCKCVAR
jgi:hypothetical protein